MSLGDWLMVLACLFFVLSGLAKAVEKQGLVAVALIFIGLANAILLTASRKP